jgi:hypothetical protein
MTALTIFIYSLNNLLLMMVVMMMMIIIIIIGKVTISFMHGTYIYIPETNHVPKEYSVAVVLSLLFMLPILQTPVLSLMYLYISTFRSMCAVSDMAVFCSSLIIMVSWYGAHVFSEGF